MAMASGLSLLSPLRCNVRSGPSAGAVCGDVVLGSALVLVGLAVFRFRLSNAIALSVIAVSALAHGHVHGRELVVDLSEPGMPLGFIAATAALHLFGVLLAYLTSRTDVRAFRATS